MKIFKNFEISSYKIKMYDKILLDNIKKPLDKIKNIPKENKELLKLLLFFVFIIIKVKTGRESYKNITETLKTIKKDLPENINREKTLARLKNIAVITLKKNPDSLFSFMMSIESLVQNILNVYKSITGYDKKTLEEIQTLSMNSVGNYLFNLTLDSISKKIFPKKISDNKE